MSNSTALPVVAPAEFEALTSGYRSELLAHCRRILGSRHEAEDQVQETYLRAWRSFGGLEKPSSLRSWLYRIATRTCLTEIERRRLRPTADAEVGESSASEQFRSYWSQETREDPADLVVGWESVRSALALAVRLSPRQRAVFLLRAVLRWSAVEVADSLGMTVPAVNSALQRAREHLARNALTQRVPPLNGRQQDLLERCTAALATDDVAALTALAQRNAGLDSDNTYSADNADTTDSAASAASL